MQLTVSRPMSYRKFKQQGNLWVGSVLLVEERVDKIICPGCGWVGTEAELVHDACPTCGYENGEEPYRLLTLAEMLAEPARAEGVWNDVDIGPFLRAVRAQIRGTVTQTQPLAYGDCLQMQAEADRAGYWEFLDSYSLKWCRLADFLPLGKFCLRLDKGWIEDCHDEQRVWLLRKESTSGERPLLCV